MTIDYIEAKDNFITYTKNNIERDKNEQISYK
jgi:hypothetical protein